MNVDKGRAAKYFCRNCKKNSGLLDIHFKRTILLFIVFPHIYMHYTSTFYLKK